MRSGTNQSVADFPEITINLTPCVCHSETLRLLINFLPIITNGIEWVS